jgi:hypothetical protein
MTQTNGVRVIVGGDGTRFFLIKDSNHLWGLWQGTQVGIEPVLVPLPGLKHSDCDAMIPWDGTMVVYVLSRVVFGTTTYHPLWHLELSAPQFKAPVLHGHLQALEQRLDAVERAIGGGGDNLALEGRLISVEERIKAAGETLIK